MNTESQELHSKGSTLHSTCYLLGPNLVTVLDGNEVIVDKGSVSTDLSATTWAGQVSPSHVEWTLLGSEDGGGGSVGVVREQRQRGGSGQSTCGLDFV